MTTKHIHNKHNTTRTVSCIPTKPQQLHVFGRCICIQHDNLPDSILKTRLLTLNVERNLVFSLLKLTQKSPILTTHIKNDIKIPTETMLHLLEKLQTEDLLNLNNDKVEVTTNERIKLAIKAVSLGADVQQVSDFLSWQEFEEITTIALHNNGFTVYKNVRFKTPNRKWEIDAIGCKQPVVICIDCKHWGHAISPLTLGKLVIA